MNSIITHPAIPHVHQPDGFEKGHAFEDYIVTLFSLKKFRLLEWRSDKRASNGAFPLSCSYPDLEFAYSGRRRNRFAVECKWRKKFFDGGIHWANNEQICIYKDYQYQNNILVLIAIGIGGLPSNPEKLFVTPLDHISMYPNVFESHLMEYKRNPGHRIDDTEQLELF